MRVHWESKQASLLPDGRVVVLVDYWLDGQATPRRREVVLPPDAGLAMMARLREAMRGVAQDEAATGGGRLALLDQLAAAQGNEEV